MSDTDHASCAFAFEADQTCWGQVVESIRHYAMLEGLEVGFADRTGELVSLTVSGPRAILELFMRRTEACLGSAYRKAPAAPQDRENFPVLSAPADRHGAPDV